MGKIHSWGNSDMAVEGNKGKMGLGMSEVSGVRGQKTERDVELYFKQIRQGRYKDKVTRTEMVWA